MVVKNEESIEVIGAILFTLNLIFWLKGCNVVFRRTISYQKTQLMIVVVPSIIVYPNIF